jgi:hypothetical protein
MIPSPTILMELPSTLSVIEANPGISVTDASSLPARMISFAPRRSGSREQTVDASYVAYRSGANLPVGGDAQLVVAAIFRRIDRLRAPPVAVA